MTAVAIYEGDATISTCRALTIWTPSLQDDVRNMIEEQKLEKQASELEQQIEQMKRQILQMEQALQGANSERLRQLKEYREELEELFAEHLQAQARAQEATDEEVTEGEMPTEDELHEAHRRFNEQRNAQMEEEQTESKTKISKRVKDLFRKIANRTHPDKVKDTKLHALFVAAKAAYKKNDYDSLEMIWRQVSGKVSNLFNAMFSRLKELRDLVAQRTVEKRVLESSDAYRMMRDYQNDQHRPHVEAHYRRLLENQISQTIAAIRALDPKRYAPKPSLSGFEFFIADEKKTVMGGESEATPWSDEDDDGIAT